MPAGYGWSFPAKDELRIGDRLLRPSLPRQGHDRAAGRGPRRRPNPLPGQLDPPQDPRLATEGGVFFAGDSAGHCLPLSAEGIRTALYFGIALGRELRGVVDGWQDREQAAARYAEFNDSHEWKFRWMLRVQRCVPKIPPRMLGADDQAAAAPSASSTGPSATTCRSRRRTSPQRSAHDQNGAGQQQDDAGHALGAERDLVQAEQP